jgi:hypothetical protein
MASKPTTAQRVENARKALEKATAKREKIENSQKEAKITEKEAQAAYDELLKLQAAEQREAFLTALQEELESRNLSTELTPALAKPLIAAYAQIVEPNGPRDETPEPADSSSSQEALDWIFDRVIGED